MESQRATNRSPSSGFAIINFKKGTLAGLLLLSLTLQTVISAQEQPSVNIESRPYAERETELTDINNKLQAGYMRQWIDITRGENVALGKTITASMEPNWRYAPNNKLENLLEGRLSKREDGKLLFAPEAFAVFGGGIKGTGLQLVVDLHQVYPIQTIAMRVMGGGPTVSRQMARQITVLASDNGVDFYEVDTFRNLGAEEADAANGKNLFYLEETGEKFVFPVRFTDLRIKARYIVFQISNTHGFVSDEIAVIKGDFGPSEAGFRPETKRIFIREGIGLYPDKNVLAVSRNIITPNFFTLVDMRKEEDIKRRVTYCLELPPYLEILQASPRLKIISVEPADSGRKKWSFRGMKYGHTVGAIYLKVSGKPDGTEDTAVFYVESEGYPPNKIEVPVRLLDIPRVPPFKEFHISLAWITDRERMEWPFFLDAYEHMGFNAVPTFPRHYMDRVIPARVDKGEALTTLNEARKRGFQILQNESTFHLIHHAAEGKDEVYSQLPDPATPRRTDRTSLCPSYRGQFYWAEIERAAEAVATVRPDIIFHDIECWGFGSSVAPKCKTCQERKAKLGIEDDREFIFALGSEHLTDLRRELERHYPVGGKLPPSGIYALKAHEEHLWLPYSWKIHSPELVDFPMPSLYVGGDILKVRNVLSAEFKAAGKRIAIPWLTTGTYGEYDPKKVEPMLYAAFLNGVAGITYFALVNFDTPLDFYYHSKALATLAPHEELLASGEIVPVACDNSSILTCAWENKRKGIALVLVYNHISTQTENAKWSLSGQGRMANITEVLSGKDIPAAHEVAVMLEPGDFLLYLIKIEKADE